MLSVLLVVGGVWLVFGVSYFLLARVSSFVWNAIERARR